MFLRRAFENKRGEIVAKIAEKGKRFGSVESPLCLVPEHKPYADISPEGERKKKSCCLRQKKYPDTKPGYFLLLN